MKQKTAIFIITLTAIVAVSIAVYDVWAISKGGTEASISYVIYEWSSKLPMFTWFAGFVPGVLVGHLFWRIRDTEGTKKISDFSRE